LFQGQEFVEVTSPSNKQKNRFGGVNGRSQKNPLEGSGRAKKAHGRGETRDEELGGRRSGKLKRSSLFNGSKCLSGAMSTPIGGPTGTISFVSGFSHYFRADSLADVARVSSSSW